MEKILRKRPAFSDFLEGIKRHDKIITAQAITLVESQLAADIDLAEKIIEAILPLTGNSIRIGITGSPGVGKSTFIEAFGKYLTSLNKKIAVLAIDPSSNITKGSILGDKTRMENLSRNANAFIRPSSTGNTLGGVANATKETILLCEAAGFDVILIETVGVGQSEVAVRDMVDFFLLLVLAGAGDELQGIKKGIMEMADGIVVTKVDGDNVERAQHAKLDLQNALHLFNTPPSQWLPRVVTSSAITNQGIEDVWKMIEQYADVTKGNAFFTINRQQQDIAWFHNSLQRMIKKEIVDAITSEEKIKELEEKIMARELSARAASNLIVKMIKQRFAKIQIEF